MSELKVTSVQTKPEFDVMYYLQVCGESRIEQGLLEELEAAWEDWSDRVSAYTLIPSSAKNDEGFLFLYLSEYVEGKVEEAWQVSPANGMAFHNLAITLVMISAQSVIPELMENCTPLPRPMKEVLDFFEKEGLEWNAQIGSLNRQYAVYTPFPFRGGCELCMQSDTCPNSTLRVED